MKLEKINGNTYYINAPTNIGVYTYKNKNCLLIDTGINSTQARKLDAVLEENKLHPKYIINTHSHFDHCGGNLYFKESYPGCLVLASQEGKLSIEKPDINLIHLYSTFPVREVRKGIKFVNVDQIIDYGTEKINDDRFEIKELKGHSSEDIGVITEDKVCFLGDSIFSEEIIHKYGLPNIYNLGAFENTLNSMDEIDADYFVIGHCEKIMGKEELIKLVHTNLQNVDKFKQQILELLDQPLSREDILENLAILNEFSMDFKQYHIYFSSVCAFITYLYDRENIDFSIDNGVLYYFQKSK